MASLTVAFTGTSSVLQADFFPEIELDPNSEYCCALLDFTSYNSIPNVIEGKNNVFSFTAKDRVKTKVGGKDVVKEAPNSKEKTIKLPTGAYEAVEILSYIKSQLAAYSINLTYEISVATSKVKISFDIDIDCVDDSVLSILGFPKTQTPRKFENRKTYLSEDIVRITHIDVIRIECDIISGSYINGKHCHTIHQFSHCKVSPGYKFIEEPRHIIYLPIKERRLRSIQISIIDQDGYPIDFRGEQISCRIHIKKIDESD